MNLFVDTSALIKLYHQEVGTENFINNIVMRITWLLS